MKKLFFIINPVAGRGMYKQGLGEALYTLYSAGYDLVCCLGGDGTLSEVTSGLMALKPEQRPPIGYFPLGTANDVATTLKLPKNDPAAVARRIAEGSPMAWDVGVFGGDRYFTYVAAFGAFTDVSYETPQQSKQALGHLAYLLEGMNRLPKLPHYRTRVEMDGEVVEGDYIFGGVTNSTSVAGLVKLDPDMVALDDGEFEVALVKYPATLADLNALVSQAVSKNFNGEMMSIRKAHTVRFTFADPVPFTRDGEPGGVHTDVKIENAHSAVRIIV